MKLGAGVLSETRMKRLRVIHGLARGRKSSEIRRTVGMSDQGIQNLLMRIRSHGVGAELRVLRAAADARERAARAPARRRGAPNVTSLAETISARLLDNEPTVALVRLVIARDVQIAVVAVRSSNRAKNVVDHETDPSTRDLYTQVLETVQNPLPAQWTRGHVDDWLARPLRFLRPIEGKVSRLTLDVCSANAVKSDYCGRWKFIAVFGGVQRVAKRALARLIPDHQTEVVAATGPVFVPFLESVISTLRVTLNIRGLFPSLSGLLDTTLDWSERESKECSFFWQCSERDTLEGVRKRIVDFQIRAAGGYLLDLSSHAHRFIPIRERFTLLTIGPRVKVERIPGDHPDDEVLDYEPIPGMPMSFEKPARLNIGKVRNAIGGKGRNARFEYAVRLGVNQRTSASLQRELLNRKSKRHPDAIAVVTVPRLFLFHDHADSVGRFQELLRTGLVGRHSAGLVRHAGEEYAYFHSSRLLNAIRKAFELNRYAERVSRINGHDAWWRALLSGPVPVSPEEGLSRRGNLFDPPIYFSDAELSLPLTDETKRKLWEAGIQCFPDSHSPKSTRSEALLLPAYSSDGAFLSLITTFDADFLLREIDGTDWRALKAEVRLWRRTILAILGEEFSTANAGGSKKIKSTIRGQHRDAAKAHESSLHDWAAKALDSFESENRILRFALECAQWSALEGEEPIPAVAISRRQILRNWKSYLGLFLRGEIEKETSKTATPLAEAVASSTAGHGHEQILDNEELMEVWGCLGRIESEGANGGDLSNFVTLARSGIFKAWAQAIEMLMDRGLHGLAKAVEESLRLLCGPSKSRSGIEDRVQQLLNEALG